MDSVQWARIFHNKLSDKVTSRRSELPFSAKFDSARCARLASIDSGISGFHNPSMRSPKKSLILPLLFAWALAEPWAWAAVHPVRAQHAMVVTRSEEHTSELQSPYV